MKSLKIIILLFLALITGILFKSGEANCESLQVVMDYYPPLSHEEKGEILGLGTQVLKAALKAAGLNANISQYPFARAYAMTQESDNIFEYCVARTPERESLFQWVGIVAMGEHGLLALKDSDTTINGLEDLKKYFIGTVYEDLVDQYLRVRTDNYQLHLDRVSNYELNMKKLLNRRFDLYGGNILVGRYLAQKSGAGADAVKEVYKFQELSVPYYLVTGLKTKPELVKKLRDGFDEIHRNGTFQKISKNYFNKK